MAPTIANPYLLTHKNLTTYTTIEEFASKYNVSVSTVKKHYKQIPGIRKIGIDEYLVRPGTRYPFNMRRHTLKNDPDRIYVLMKALYLKNYISYNELSTDEYTFLQMLFRLEADGYIVRNDYGNNDGANAYDCTAKGEKFYEDLKDQKREKRNAGISQTLDWLDKLAEIGRKFIPGTTGNDK